MDGADVLVVVERALNEYFGCEPARASVSFVGVPPIEVLRYEAVPGELSYVSLGMSRQAMTAADQPVQAADGPRAELLLQILDPYGRAGEIWRRVAVLAASPTVEGAVYSAGGGVELGEPLGPGSRCTGALLDESDVEPIETPSGAVHVLRALPATPAEMAWRRARGSAALLALWADQDIDLLDLSRRSVQFG